MVSELALSMQLVQNARKSKTLTSKVKALAKATSKLMWERSGSVVEFLTRDRGAAGSSLTGVTALWSLSKTHFILA